MASPGSSCLFLAEGFVTEDSWVIGGWSQGLSCSRRLASSGFAFEEPSAQALKDCSTDACPKASTGHSSIPLTPSGFRPLLSIPGFGSKEMWEGPQNHRDASLASHTAICVNTNPNAHRKYGLSIIHYESHLQIKRLMTNWKRGVSVRACTCVCV